MKVGVEEKSKGEYILSIKLPGEELRNELDESLRRIALTTKISGFRIGKAPLELVRMKNESRILPDIRGRLVDKAVEEALQEHELIPVMQPQLKYHKDGSDKGDIEFDLYVIALPGLELGDFGEISIEKLVLAPSESELEGSIDEHREAVRETELITDRQTLTESDIAVIDLESSVEGKAFAFGTVKGMSVRLDSNNFPFPEVLEELRTMDTGSNKERDVEVKLGDDFFLKEVAGKVVNSRVELREIRRFLEGVSGEELARAYKTKDYEEFKLKVREKLVGSNMGSVVEHLRVQLLDNLDSKYIIDVPISMENIEYTSIKREYEKSKEEGKLGEEELGRDEEELEEDFHSLARRRVKLALVLTHISRKHGIRLEKRDLDFALDNESKRYAGDVKENRKKIESNAVMMDKIQATLLENKILDFLLERVSVVEREVDLTSLESSLDEYDKSREEILETIKEKEAKASAKTATKTSPKTTEKATATAKAAPKTAAKTSPKATTKAAAKTSPKATTKAAAKATTKDAAKDVKPKKAKTSSSKTKGKDNG